MTVCAKTWFNPTVTLAKVADICIDYIELLKIIFFKGEPRLIVWHLQFNLGQLLVPSRLGYSLEPDITAGAAFNIKLGTYPESNSLYSPKLPIPAFPILLSDLDSMEQPGRTYWPTLFHFLGLAYFLSVILRRPFASDCKLL